MNHDLLDHLQATDPAAGHTGYDDSTIEANLAALMGTPNRKHRRPWYIAAAAAVLMGGLLLGQALTPTPTTAAAETLRATAAAVPADPPARGDQYWKVVTTGIEDFGVTPDSGADPTTWEAEYIRTQYVSADGTRPNWEVVEYTGGTHVSGPELPFPRPAVEVSTRDLTDSQLPLDFAFPTAAFLATLPRDPDALAAALRAQAEKDLAASGNTVEGRIFATARIILLSGRAPADLRAALLRALATLPDLELTEGASVLGHTGVGVRLAEQRGAPTVMELVIDPTDGEILGERSLVLTDFNHHKAGDVAGPSHVTRELVDAVPADVQRRAVRFECRIEGQGVHQGMFCDSQR